MRQSRHRYGRHRSQVADLYRPDEDGATSPVVVLIHGGFWRAMYTKRLMAPLARALVAEGYAALNVEYRRLRYGGGFPATFIDISRAIDELSTVGGIDLSSVVTVGHSAGGTLALFAGGPSRRIVAPAGQVGGVTVTGAIALAGVVDLAAGATNHLGAGAIERLLGGGPEDLPDRYGAASPAATLPLGIPTALLHGTADSVVPLEMSEAFVRRAKLAGDDSVCVTLVGATHLNIIVPQSEPYEALLDQLARLCHR